CGVAPPGAIAAGTVIEVDAVPNAEPVEPRIAAMWEFVPILVLESRLMKPVPPCTAVEIALCQVLFKESPRWAAMINWRLFRSAGGDVVETSNTWDGIWKFSKYSSAYF